jgi:purine-nucleoside phosphorylase
MMRPMLPETFSARVGVVLGSGLGGGLEGRSITAEIPYAGIPGLPAPTVPGHGGRFLRCDIDGIPLLAASGRIHLYEGHPARDVGAIVRLMHAVGVRCLLLTNAAGGLHPDWPPGTFMRITDHLNLTGTSPLEGAANFQDMTRAYDGELGGALDVAAGEAGLELRHGVYAGLRGPQYETPAEVRMLRVLGADTVGMSTVLETLQARALGMKVAGLSLVTNLAAGVGSEPLDHHEVMDAGRAAAAGFGKLIAAWLPEAARLAESA